MADKTYSLLKYEDFNSEENKKITEALKEKNASLYSMIRLNLQVNDSAVIRSDVLEYLSENADMIADDMEEKNIIASMARSEYFGEEWYAWTIDHFLGDNRMGIAGFEFVINSSKDNELSLENIKHIFEENHDNYTEITKKIKALISSEDTEGVSQNNESVKAEEPPAPASEKVSDQAFFEADEATKIFPKLISAISIPSPIRPEMTTEMLTKASEIQQKIMNILEPFCLEQMKAYAKAWNEDADYIARLNSVVELQKTFIEGQQEKINELTTQLSAVYEKLDESESERKMYEKTNVQLAKKIKALQDFMTSDTDPDGED